MVRSFVIRLRKALSEHDRQIQRYMFIQRTTLHSMLVQSLPEQLLFDVSNEGLHHLIDLNRERSYRSKEFERRIVIKLNNDCKRSGQPNPNEHEQIFDVWQGLYELFTSRISSDVFNVLLEGGHDRFRGILIERRWYDEIDIFGIAKPGEII